MEERQEYLVLAQIGGAGDPEIWQPGSRIWLTAKGAAAHLASANVCATETTQPFSVESEEAPLPMEPQAITDTTEEPEQPTGRRLAKVEVAEEPTMEVDAWQS